MVLKASYERQLSTDLLSSCYVPGMVLSTHIALLHPHLSPSMWVRLFSPTSPKIMLDPAGSNKHYNYCFMTLNPIVIIAFSPVFY